ncbi:MAG: Cof-type HAD-IIB family hydrolase [Eggerthellaceae bacterium]|jgi:Cof subfamily protein (haloacid dehalogenase superfamily)
MSHPNYRLLAVDLDGTLTTSDKKISPRTRKALYAAIDAGVSVALASGRPLVGVGPVADDLELDRRGGFLLCANGAQIIDWKSSIIYEDRTIPRMAIDLSCQLARQHHVQALCYDDREGYAEDPSDPYVEQERYNNSAVMNKVDNLAATITWEPNKMMVVGEPEKLSPVFERLSALLEGHARVIRSDPYFLEIVPDGVGKDTGLMKLGGLLGIPRSETMAIGDGYNDIGMLDYAGLAVSVENAYDEVKPHTDWTAPSNDEDGVAAAIDRFILAPGAGK